VCECVNRVEGDDEDMMKMRESMTALLAAASNSDGDSQYRCLYRCYLFIYLFVYLCMYVCWMDGCMHARYVPNIAKRVAYMTSV